MKNLAGKTAFITGGAAGLGLAMAKSLAGAGMNIVLTDIEEDTLQQAVENFDGANTNVHGIVLDVTDRDAWVAAADEAEAKFGPVHVVCNNAGVAGGGSLDTVSYEDWDWILGVNIGGVVNGVQTFVQRMKDHGEGGHFVNTASMAGFLPSAGGIYATSKFAVVGMSEALRNDLAPHNIGVSVLCPGYVKTRIFEAHRNRPGCEAAPLGEEEALTAAMVDSGIEVDRISEEVLDGIQTNSLYIFTHPELKDVVEVRFNQVLDALGEGDVNESQVPMAQMAAAQMKLRSLKDPD